jgi:hypothetical protein
LQWDNIKETLQRIHCPGYLDLVRLLTGELWVVGVADDDGTALTSNDLLVGIEGFGKELIASQDHDNGKVLVHEGQDTVFELARHDGLAVKVGNFLDLESALTMVISRGT